MNLFTAPYETNFTTLQWHYISAGAGSRRRDPVTWAPLTQTPDFLLTRGYTGHEHLDEFGLLNMNGRLYDPLLGRMLSPDNYVQDASGTQNFNRYSYCTNNPLTKIDPSGDIAWYVPFIVSASLSGIGGFIEGSSKGLKGDALFRYSVNSSIYGGITGGFGALAGSGSYGISAIKGDGVLIGAVNGSISGAVSGAVVGFVKSGDLDDAWSGLIFGAVNGALYGAAWGGISAYKGNRNVWTGNRCGVGRGHFAINNTNKQINSYAIQGGTLARNAISPYGNRRSRFTERVWQNDPNTNEDGMIHYLGNAISQLDIKQGENIAVINLNLSKFRGALFLECSGWIDEGYTVQIESDTEIFTFLQGTSQLQRFTINPTETLKIKLICIGALNPFATTTAHFYTYITGYIP